MEIEGEGEGSPPAPTTAPYAPPQAPAASSTPPSPEDFDTALRVLNYLLANIPEARKAKYMYVIRHCVFFNVVAVQFSI
jgi:hypothetical protein